MVFHVIVVPAYTFRQTVVLGECQLGETLPASESGEAVGDAVSNPAAPAPPENQEDPIVGNDMESDGLTNEEAGLD